MGSGRSAPSALVCDSPGDTPWLALRGSPEDRPLPFSFPGSIGTRPPARWGQGPAAHPVLRSSGRMKKRGSGWKASRKTGRRASMPECQDVRMSECQNVRMSECQSVRMLECQNVRMSGCQDVRMPAMTEARSGAGGRASGCRRGGARDGGKERLRASPGGGGPHPPSIACRGAGHASRGVWEMMERK